MGAVVEPTSTDAIRPFLLRVTLEGAEGDGLLRVASALHRRQLDIRQAAYERVATRSSMEIVIETTAARVQTALHTVRAIIGVTACEILPGGHVQHETWQRHGRLPQREEARARARRHPDRAALPRGG